MEHWRSLVVVFASIVAWGVVVASWINRSGTGDLRGDEPMTGVRGLVEPLVPLGYRVATFFGTGIEDKVAAMIRQAGGKGGLSAPEFFGLQALCGLSGGGGALLVYILSTAPPIAGFLFVLGGLAIGWYAPYSSLVAQAKKRKKQILHALPFCLDLMATSMQPGYDFNAAASVYVEKGKPGPLRDELSMMLREMRLGKSRKDALLDMTDRIGISEMRAVTGAVVQGSELGTGVSNILVIQSEEMRRKRFVTAEKVASHAPAKMIFPMAFLIVPATMVVIIVPIVLKFIRK